MTEEKKYFWKMTVCGALLAFFICYFVLGNLYAGGSRKDLEDRIEKQKKHTHDATAHTHPELEKLEKRIRMLEAFHAPIPEKKNR